MALERLFIEFSSTVFTLDSLISFLFKLLKSSHFLSRVHGFGRPSSWSWLRLLFLQPCKSRWLVWSLSLLLPSLQCHSKLHRLQFPFAHSTYLFLIMASSHFLLHLFCLFIVSYMLPLVIVYNTLSLRIKLFPLLSKYFLANSNVLFISHFIKWATTLFALIQVSWCWICIHRWLFFFFPVEEGSIFLRLCSRYRSLIHRPDLLMINFLIIIKIWLLT